MLRRIERKKTPTEPRDPRERDRWLAARARDGDRSAAQELLLTHTDRIRRLVTRLVGGGPDVDDLTQVVCIETLKSLKRYRGDASFTLWVDRVTTHTVYKYFRTNKRRRARIGHVEDPDRSAQPVDPDRRMEWREAVERAREVIDEPKPERRVVFVLVAVEGRTVEEAAAILDLSLSAAKSRYLRARRDIDRRLSERPELAQLLGRARQEVGHG